MLTSKTTVVFIKTHDCMVSLAEDERCRMETGEKTFEGTHLMSYSIFQTVQQWNELCTAHYVNVEVFFTLFKLTLHQKIFKNTQYECATG